VRLTDDRRRALRLPHPLHLRSGSVSAPFVFARGQDDNTLNWPLLKGKTQVDLRRHTAPVLIPAGEVEGPAPSRDFNPPADDRN